MILALLMIVFSYDFKLRNERFLFACNLGGDTKEPEAFSNCHKRNLLTAKVARIEIKHICFL